MDSFLFFASKTCLLIVIFLIYFYLIIQLLLLLLYELSGGLHTLPNIVTNKRKTKGLKNITYVYSPVADKSFQVDILVKSF